MKGAAALAERRKLYLGDEPGLGKTTTALAAAALIGAQHITVICPAIVRPHWWREAREMGIHLYGVVSYNYAVDKADYLRLALRDADLLIIDEAHFCKNPTSQRTRLIFGTGGLAQQVLANGGRVWCLSGTPMPRNPAEMFPVISALWPQTLANRGVGGYMGWLNRFCVWKANRYGIKVLGSKNDAMLQEILGKVMLRRLIQNVAGDLPPLRWGILTLDADAVAEILLAEVGLSPEEREALRDGIIPPMSPNINRYRHQIGDLKAKAVTELMLEELNTTDQKRVLFCYHRSVLDKLEFELQAYGVVRIDGNTSPTQREERVRQFREIPARRVFLGQIGACGVGLDGLQFAANEVIIVEPDWSRDVNIQAAHRLARIGQALPVQIRMITLEGSLDEAIVRQFHRECAMVERIVG
jgi:SWI/SNF-related matrix-associated actin-dependent regulator 1 of chromatin subfamily A